jgi:uncharacterized protein (DUF983 family)
VVKGQSKNDAFFFQRSLTANNLVTAPTLLLFFMSTIPKPSAFTAIFGLKCASCRRGKMFKTPTFSFSKPFEMNKLCPKCEVDLEPEPGFYFGAMFISYGITVWPMLGLMAIFRWGLEWSLFASFAVTLVITAILFVYIFRVSRSMYLNMMVRYKPSRAARAVAADG